jgi:hypothetical protein
MSAIVDRIDNGDNYNEDDARRYFNELIDIVHSRPPNTMMTMTMTMTKMTIIKMPMTKMPMTDF